MKAIFIDSTKRTVAEIEFEGVTDGVRKLVGGWIEMARGWENGDVLYVDEEGRFKPQTGHFEIEGNPYLLYGNGVLVGRELEDGDGEFLGTAPPTMTVADVLGLVRFYPRG